jgi:hemolysin activation/secretion protein
MIGRASVALALLAAAMLPLGLRAAPPTPATPGTVEETLKRPSELKPPPAPSITAPAAPAAAAPEAGPTLVVSRFEFSGNTVFGTDVLAPLVSDYVGKPVTLGQLYQAADRIAEFYTRHGYSLASVAVPAQKVENGVVRLQVIEGRVGQIGFEGNRRYRNDLLGWFMTKTKSGEVYRAAPLQEDLQTLNALPGLAARAILKPGAEYGTSDVTIKTAEDPIAGNLILDNYGRKDIGEYRLAGSVTLNNPLTIADQLQLLGVHSTTNRLNYGYLDYNAPLARNGLRAQASFGYARFKVAPPFSVGGKNENAQFSLIQPFWRRPDSSLLGSAGVIYTKADADLSGLPISATQIALLNLGTTYTRRWSDSGVTQVIGSLHSDFSKATASARNAERVRLELNAQHLQPLPAELQLLAQFDGVYSPDPLPDTEQFSIGGPTTVRGYPPAEVRGDRGVFGSLALRRPWAIGPLTLLPRLEVDAGQVYRLDLPPGADADDGLISAGAGLDVLYRQFDLKLDWAYPIGHKPVSDGRNDGRLYAALSAGF